MSRPKSIPWEKRVSIFLDFRRRGKVQPVAKRHKVARSTVKAIVGEFQADGFTDKPRTSASPDFLREMQERHLHEVSAKLKHPFLGAETFREFLGQGIVDTEPPRSEKAATADPLVLDDDITWHLKGTEAESVVTEARKAARDFQEKWQSAQSDLQTAVAKACGLPMKPYSPAQGASSKAYIFPQLAGLIYREFLSPQRGSQPPSPTWPVWWSNPADPSPRLRANDVEVALGPPHAQEKIKRGIAEFLHSGLAEFQRRFLGLARMQRELSYVDEIVRTKLATVNEADLRHSICPACPYPEAREELVDQVGKTAQGSNLKAQREVTK